LTAANRELGLSMEFAVAAKSAYRLGALGYVIKQHAAQELLSALEAVRQGRQFVRCDR
jgi:DNA-binding NarL/FixJ family response regulator